MEVKDRVTIICIAYNQEEWIQSALESVQNQDYYSKELIVVDNGSSDSTADKIRSWIDRNAGLFPIQAYYLEETKPYCKLFNEMLSKSSGHYLVDLSGDDMLFPDHLSESVKELERYPQTAFVFSDAYLMDELGEIKCYYKRDSGLDLIEEIETSTIYQTLIRRSFICSPTVVFNATILKAEGGYDEDLFYEDFDIHLRLTRKYFVLFSDHIGVRKNNHGESMSSGQYERYHSKMLPSTVKVCRKIRQMNHSPEEDDALRSRIMYELKHALWSSNFGPAQDLVSLGQEMKIKSPVFWIYRLWARKKWDISWLYLWLT